LTAKKDVFKILTPRKMV